MPALVNENNTNMNTKVMVVGFLFNPQMDTVTLIRKDRPEWQAGKLNGVGGAMREDEDGIEAMIREFKEETGVETNETHWSQFANLNGGDWQVQCFCGALQHIPTQQEGESEEPRCYQLFNGFCYDDCINNLSWLIPLALDHLRVYAERVDASPEMVQVEYPR